MIENILQSIFSASYLAAILRISTPLLLPSLGALISEKAGVVNIGLEGIMLTAAFTGATIGGLSGSALLGAALGMLSGVMVALLLAFFHLQFGGDIILGGVAINILGAAGQLHWVTNSVVDARAVLTSRRCRCPRLTLRCCANCLCLASLSILCWAARTV